VPLTPRRPSASSGPGGSGPGAAEFGLQPVDDALLLRSQADRVRGEAHLVTLASHHAVTLQGGEELGEHLLLGMSGPAPELLPGDPAPERVLGMECLEEGQGLRAETVARLTVDVPLAVHGGDRLGLLKLVEEAPEALRAEGHAGAQVGGAKPGRSRLAQVLFDHLWRRSRL